MKIMLVVFFIADRLKRPAMRPDIVSMDSLYVQIPKTSEV